RFLRNMSQINKPPVPLLTPVAATTPTGTTPTVDNNKKKKENMRTVLILEHDIDFQPNFKSNLKRTLQEVKSHDPDWDLVLVTV
uniref:Uncharacterized protein n=1 Tax=Amphimedon queenslandica TaxID=400682 RepID=A0A1X7SNZ5_AMPQE